MVREEQDRRLHLLSVISPEWVRPGQEISVKRAPTNFGQVNFDVKFSDAGATIALNNDFSQRPQDIVLHLPWFVNLSGVTADGKKINVVNNAAVLPASVRRVQIAWQKKADAPALNYENAVKDYKTEYRRRYEHWLQTGQNQRAAATGR